MKNLTQIISNKFIFIILICNLITSIATENLITKQEIKDFILHMHTKHNFSVGELNKLFVNYEPNKEVIAKISNPSEKLNWGKYKQLLISKERIIKGKEFLKKHFAELTKIEQHYGVPKELIVAILGIESFYGERSGNIPVINALATLSFDYQPRASFFKQQLEEFLLLTREEKLDPTQMKGSYAGAFSPAQFIPSSYRNYAVDFANVGSKDLNNISNSMGSIANYLHKNGWRKQQPIANRVRLKEKNNGYLKYIEKEPSAPKPKYYIKELLNSGIITEKEKSLPSKAALIEFIVDPQKNHKEYWLGFDNFYAITRYNHSANYAMAVYQLALLIKN